MVVKYHRPTRQAAKPSEVMGPKIVGKSSGLSAATVVANVEIMKMAVLTIRRGVHSPHLNRRTHNKGS
jgi:hypothetical protein